MRLVPQITIAAPGSFASSQPVPAISGAIVIAVEVSIARTPHRARFGDGLSGRRMREVRSCVHGGWRHPGRTGAIVYALAALVFGGLITIVSRLRLAEARGRRRAARSLPDGPIIIVSNHASYADGILLALVCRRLGRSVRLLATAGVFRVPVIGSLVRSVGFIPVQRRSSTAADALEPAAEALAAGEAVGIFPEGRTTRDPGHWPERAKTGAVRLALRTGAPIVPIAMVGTHRVLSRRSPVRSILTSLVLRPEVLTRVGDPIDVGAMAQAAGHDPDDVRELTDEVWSRIVGLVEDLRADAAPDARGVDPADG